MKQVCLQKKNIYVFHLFIYFFIFVTLTGLCLAPLGFCRGGPSCLSTGWCCRLLGLFGLQGFLFLHLFEDLRGRERNKGICGTTLVQQRQGICIAATTETSKTKAAVVWHIDYLFETHRVIQVSLKTEHVCFTENADKGEEELCLLPWCTELSWPASAV